MYLLTIQVLITLLLCLSIIYLVYKEFRSQDEVNEPYVPCMIQYICDDKYDVSAECRVAAIEKETKIKELEKRRREYKAWMENCNKIFGKESNVSHERKVDLRIIDGAA